MELSVEGAPKLRVGDWVRATIIAFIVTMFLGILAATLLHQWVGDAIFLLGWPVLTFGMVTHHRLASARHTQRMKEVRERVLRQALSRLPEGLAGAMTQPLQRLCADILSYEGAFRNRRLSPRKIEEILSWLLYYCLLDPSRQLQVPNLLTLGEGGEATFSLPLHSLHADVAHAIQNVLNTIGHHLSWQDGTPFKYLVKTLYDNWAAVNGFHPDRGEQPPKKTLGPADLKDTFPPAELVSFFLSKTPFYTFFHTPLPVAIPHRSRFEHMQIVAGTGHGKTQLLQYLILNDLPHVAAGNRTSVVIDSQGDLINNILSLAAVGAMAERVVLIDPEETTSPPALNLFDFGLERANRYSRTQRENLVNSAIALCEYVFGAVMGAALTAKQGVIFGYLAQLMMVVPDATIDTLIDFLEEPEAVRAYLAKIDDPITKRFFHTQFFHKSFDDTRQQILYRIYDVLKTRALARMFRHKRNKLDMFSAMNRGSLILIDTAKGFLGQEGCEIFGRFFTALICQSALEREPIAQYNRRDTFVYIDEAHDYFDTSIEHLLAQVRKYRVGLAFAHQHLAQLRELRATVMANTAIKLVGGLTYDDAREFAKNMGRNTTPEFLLGMRKHADDQGPYTDFACYIKNIEGLERAIPFRVPLGVYDRQPKITPAMLASLKEANRERYGGATDEHPPEKPKDDDSPLGEPELL
jgi:uncharacterized membrane protein YoaK (UPF0700 family)